MLEKYAPNRFYEEVGDRIYIYEETDQVGYLERLENEKFNVFTKHHPGAEPTGVNFETAMRVFTRLRKYGPNRFYEEIGSRIYIYGEPRQHTHHHIGYLERLGPDKFKVIRDDRPVASAEAVTFEEAMTMYEQD